METAAPPTNDDAVRFRKKALSVRSSAAKPLHLQQILRVQVLRLPFCFIIKEKKRQSSNDQNILHRANSLKYNSEGICFLHTAQIQRQTEHMFRFELVPRSLHRTVPESEMNYMPWNVGNHGSISDMLSIRRPISQNLACRDEYVAINLRLSAPRPQG